MELVRIQKDFEDALVSSQCYPFKLDSKNLINQWYESKKHFINRLGGMSWRSEHPIRFHLSPQQKENKFSDFLTIIRGIDLSKCENSGVDFLTFLQENSEGFFNNRVIKDYPQLKLHAGMRLLKSFKLFCPDEDCMRFAQDVASQYIQEDKLEGYLYISVDPLDFLTISENEENWYTCQALFGDYRGGILNYMVDDTTFIAFIADKNRQLKCLSEGMKWNSKKWRVLVHADEDKSILYSKSYPFQNEEILQTIDQKIKEVLYPDVEFGRLRQVGFKKVGTEINTAYTQLCLNGRVYDSRDILDYGDFLGFSDIIESPNYDPQASIVCQKFSDYWLNKADLTPSGCEEKAERKAFKDIFGLKIGKKALCPCCGKDVIKRRKSFLCETCIKDKGAQRDFFRKCADCGCRVYEDNFTVKGVTYCKDCYRSVVKEE